MSGAWRDVGSLSEAISSTRIQQRRPDGLQALCRWKHELTYSRYSHCYSWAWYRGAIVERQRIAVGIIHTNARSRGHVLCKRR